MHQAGKFKFLFGWRLLFVGQVCLSLPWLSILVFKSCLFALPKASSERTKLASSTSFLGGNFFLSKSVSLFIGLGFWCSETICLHYTIKKRSAHQRQAWNTPRGQVQLPLLDGDFFFLVKSVSLHWLNILVFRSCLFAPPKARLEHTKLASSPSFLGGDFSFLVKSVSLFIGSQFWSSEAVCLLHHRQAWNAPSWQVQLPFWVATSPS
jgi:hypothetical protein